MTPQQAWFPLVPARRKSLAVAVSTAAALAGVQAAQADLVIEEVIVTATKRSENLQDIAQSVQAFGTEDIRRQHLVGIDDYAKKIPALSFASREPGGTSIIFRGIATSGVSFGTKPSSGIYLDEQPITSAGRNLNPRLIDVERLEALSGPQGTLFGDASQSGVLRIITNKPDSDDSYGWVSGEVNGYEKGDVGHDLSGMANIALVPGKLALRLVGFDAREAGYIDNVLRRSRGGTYTNSDVADANVNSADVMGGRAQLRWDVNADWVASFNAIYEKTDMHGFGDVSPELDDLQQLRYQEEGAEDEWYQLGLTVEGSVGGFDTTLAVSYFNREFHYDADATDYDFTLSSNVDHSVYAFYDFGADPRGYADLGQQDDRWSVEARVATPADSDSRWSGVVGLFYNKDKSESLFQSFVHDFEDTAFFTYLNDLAYAGNGSFRPATDNWWVGSYESELEQKALFGEISFDVTEQLSITAGGRWYDVSDTFHQIQGRLQDGKPDPNIEPIGLDSSGGSDESGFAGKVSVKWQINDDRMVYATYSEGFRSGGSNALKSTSSLDRTYESDFLKNYELGAKTTWLDGALQLNASVYHMVWENIQIQVEDPIPQIYQLAIINFPEAEINGFEGDLIWLPAEGWEVSATLARVDAFIAETARINPGTSARIVVPQNTALPITPDWKGSFSVERVFIGCSIFGGEPSMRVDYSYNGDSVNSLGVQSFIGAAGPKRQDNYFQIDASVSLEGEDWSAQLYVQNLTDERSEQFFNGRWGSDRFGADRLSIGDPLSFGVALRKDF